MKAEEASQVTKELVSNIKVKMMGDIVGVFGRRELEVSLPQGSSVTELLRLLSKEYGQNFATEIFNAAGGLLPNLVVFVNGEDIKYLHGVNTTLFGNEVEIVVLPIFEGG